MNECHLFFLLIFTAEDPVLHLKTVYTMILERKCSYMPLRDIMSVFLPMEQTGAGKSYTMMGKQEESQRLASFRR